jgi:hypothetical protein
MQGWPTLRRRFNGCLGMMVTRGSLGAFKRSWQCLLSSYGVGIRTASCSCEQRRSSDGCAQVSMSYVALPRNVFVSIAATTPHRNESARSSSMLAKIGQRTGTPSCFVASGCPLAPPSGRYVPEKVSSHCSQTVTLMVGDKVGVMQLVESNCPDHCLQTAHYEGPFDRDLQSRNKLAANPHAPHRFPHVGMVTSVTAPDTAHP